MRYIVTVVLALIILMLLSCETHISDKGPKSDSVENTDDVVAETKPTQNDVPLLLDDSPLLLADEPLMHNSTDTETVTSADNSRCHVCHINYTLDDLAVTHAREGIGCTGCHGQSDEHIADESWASGGNGTAPEKMYPKDKINPFCLTCHEADKLPAQQHKAVLIKNPDKVCTDCHGDHRLPIRRCKWK